MKISDKILSIPPYISTSWKSIVSLQVEPRPFGHVLVIELVTGSKVEIPNLERPVIEQLFAYHAKVLEDEEKEKNSSLMTAAMPFPLIFPNLPNLEGLTSMIQHNEEQKDTPPLPTEMLEKISEMTKGLLPEDVSAIQPPEPSCNCPHCQITRAILGKQEAPQLEIEEEVTDEDLKFRSWDIKQENDKLYSVTNPFDAKEHYNVFLGDPIGCTCGDKNCVHIEAVLKS